MKQKTRTRKRKAPPKTRTQRKTFPRPLNWKKITMIPQIPTTLRNSRILKSKFSISTAPSKSHASVVSRLTRHSTVFRINILTEPSNNVEEIKSDDVIYLGDGKPVVLKPSQKSRSRGNSESKVKQQKTAKGKRDFIIQIIQFEKLLLDRFEIYFCERQANLLTILL